jgi:hypothetical protein
VALIAAVIVTAVRLIGNLTSVFSKVATPSDTYLRPTGRLGCSLDRKFQGMRRFGANAAVAAPQRRWQ